MAMPIWWRLFWHWARLAASRTCWTAGTSRPISMAIIAITTSNSISVNADRPRAWKPVGVIVVLRTKRREHNCQVGLAALRAAHDNDEPRRPRKQHSRSERCSREGGLLVRHSQSGEPGASATGAPWRLRSLTPGSPTSYGLLLLAIVRLAMLSAKLFPERAQLRKVCPWHPICLVSPRLQARIGVACPRPIFHFEEVPMYSIVVMAALTTGGEV